jgi:transcriptional regulator GlxA family with amidase domain
MAANKTSAVDDQEPIDVLFALQDKFDLLDFAGPLQVFATAAHDFNNAANSKAFEVTIAAAEPKVLSDQGVIVASHINFKEAHDRLEEFDVLVVVGGNSAEVLDKEAEPLGLINDFSELQKKDPGRERTIVSVCTGALFLGRENILSGLSATTHPDYITKFENICSDAATRNLTERTDVLEDARYVVNNLRFDLGDEDDNPYIRRKSDSGRRPSNARKGSMSFKGSNSRRESIARRAAMRLGGLRVITAGGNSAGVDAALYLVSAMVDDGCAAEVARILQWSWNKGVVVDGLDV